MFLAPDSGPGQKNFGTGPSTVPVKKNLVSVPVKKEFTADTEDSRSFVNIELKIIPYHCL